MNEIFRFDALTCHLRTGKFSTRTPKTELCDTETVARRSD